MTSPEYQAPTWVNEDDPDFIEGVSPDLGAGYLNQLSGAVEDHGQRLGAITPVVTYLNANAISQDAGDNRYILQDNAVGFAPAEATANALAGKQPLDADLTALAGLDSTTAGTVASDGAGWVKKTYAQLRTALGLSTIATSGKIADAADLTTTGAAVGGVLAVDPAWTGAGTPDFTVLPPAGAVATAEVAAFGDSRIESSGVDWPGTLLATELGVPVYNGGKSGWASSDIALRQGGLKVGLTVTGNQIPASGPVTVTARTPGNAWRVGHTGATYTWGGTLAGVPGTLAHVHDGDTWTFTRTTPGSAVSCPAGTPFICTDGDAYRRRMQVFWIDRNNFSAGSATMADAYRDYGSMAAYLIHADPQCIVLGATNASTEGKGTANYRSVVTLNGQLARRYGSRFIDVRSWLITNGLPYTGISPTSQDLTDIANDVIPSSLRADTTHPNATGYGIVAKLVADRMRQLGWSPSAPAAPPSQPSLSAGTSATNSQGLTWTAASNAVGYKVEYRRAGSQVWLPGPNTTSAAATVTGLDQGLYYEYRVTGYSLAGPGTPSDKIAAKTSGTSPAVVTSDSFDRANATSLGTTDAALGGTGMAWTSDGEIGIVSNQAARTGTTGLRRATFPAGVLDGRLKARINNLTDSYEIYLLGRYTDGNNHYRLTINTIGNAYLQKVVAATTTQIGTTQVGAVLPGDTVALSVIGSSLIAYVNENPVITATDTAITTGTLWGIGLAPGLAARLDDLVLFDR